MTTTTTSKGDKKASLAIIYKFFAGILFYFFYQNYYLKTLIDWRIAAIVIFSIGLVASLLTFFTSKTNNKNSIAEVIISSTMFYGLGLMFLFLFLNCKYKQGLHIMTKFAVIDKYKSRGGQMTKIEYNGFTKTIHFDNYDIENTKSITLNIDYGLFNLPIIIDSKIDK